ncbi:MAG: zinc ribbon domain-containing protein [Leptolyngbya sp. ERB_1_1]
MPLYEFKCDDCGVFDQWRSMSESAQPASCPMCQEPAKRIFSAPMLLNGSLRVSKQANPEPQRVQRSEEPIAPKLRSHTEGRPWMISH